MAIDRARWEQLAARMRTRWPDQLSNIKSEAYFSALSDLGKSELERGVDELIAGDGEELPTPAELRAAATGDAPARAGRAAPSGAAGDGEEEQKILGIPASWLLSAAVAVVVAAVIVVVFVVAFDDDGGGSSNALEFEPTRVEIELIEFDWENDLAVSDATCLEPIEGEMDCTVEFENARELRVTVTSDDNGELTIDVPDDEPTQGGQGEQGGGEPDEGVTGGEATPAPSQTTP